MQLVLDYCRKLALRKKLAMALAIMILLNTFTSFYYSIQVSKLTEFIGSSQKVYYRINELLPALESINKQLSIYVEQKRPQAYTTFVEKRETVKSLVSTFGDPSSSTDQIYAIRSIRNTTESLIDDCNLLFWQINAADPDYYVTYYRAQNKLSYLSGYISDYLNLLLTQNALNQDQLTQQARSADMLNKLFLVCNALFCIFLTIFFAGYITRPISELASAAKQISQGNFNVPDVQVFTDDEVGQLTRSFNVMRASIENSIEDLNKRAELEAQLHQQEMENLQMAKLLHEAQYLALQSQINPHFLFNTLNVIARAIVHDTPQTTSMLIYSLADLFRYNIDHFNTFSTLQEELDIVEKYMCIQKHRFRERINYIVSGDSDCGRALIPSMLIQPLVENAIIHGIEHLEYGGTIITNIQRKNDTLLLRIYDNGIGISESVLRTLHQGHKDAHTGHTTGIGLSNIINRINLIPGADIKIKSGRYGTLIRICIPWNEEQSNNVQSFDC